MTSAQTGMAVFRRMTAVVPHRGQRDKPEHDEVREQEGRHRRSAAQEFVEQRRRAPLQIGLRVVAVCPFVKAYLQKHPIG